MTDLLTKTQQIWDTIRQSVEGAMTAGNTLDGIEAFYDRRTRRGAEPASPAMYTLDRSVRTEEAGASRGVGEFRVVFGITSSSIDPGEALDSLEPLAHKVIELFYNSPTLNGETDDVRLEEFHPDAEPFGEDDPRAWVTLELVWSFQFLRT